MADHDVPDHMPGAHGHQSEPGDVARRAANGPNEVHLLVRTERLTYYFVDLIEVSGTLGPDLDDLHTYMMERDTCPGPGFRRFGSRLGAARTTAIGTFRMAREPSPMLAKSLVDR